MEYKLEQISIIILTCITYNGDVDKEPAETTTHIVADLNSKTEATVSMIVRVILI